MGGLVDVAQRYIGNDLESSTMRWSCPKTISHCRLVPVERVDSSEIRADEHVSSVVVTTLDKEAKMLQLEAVSILRIAPCTNVVNVIRSAVRMLRTTSAVLVAITTSKDIEEFNREARQIAWLLQAAGFQEMYVPVPGDPIHQAYGPTLVAHRVPLGVLWPPLQYAPEAYQIVKARRADSPVEAAS